MAFASQGAISGARGNTNALFKGTTAGRAYSASIFDVDKFQKQINDSVEKDTQTLKEDIESAKKSDLESLDNQYEKVLDNYISEENTKKLYDEAYETGKADLDEQFNSKKSGLSTYYLNQLTSNYNKALTSLSDSLNSQINDLVKVVNTAKELKDTKADEKTITSSEIRDFQNQLIDTKEQLEDEYDTIYSNQLKSLQDTYQTYEDSVMNQIKAHGQSMFGKRVAVKPKYQMRIRRLYPRLNGHIRKPRVKIMRFKLNIPLVTSSSKKGMSLSAQFDRNFRRML